MRSNRLLVAVLLLIGLALSSEAAAQMFGQRTLGRPLTRGSARRSVAIPQTAETVGQIQGTERYLRGNRSARDFVGASVDRSTFVGQQQAELTGPVVSAVRDLRPQREVNLNQALRQSRSAQLYSPRLRPAFDYSSPDGQVVGERIAAGLQFIETLQVTEPIEVSVADGTATLRGRVASVRDKELIERLVRFEPGISAVRNDLQVGPPAPSDPPLPPPPDSQQP